MKNLKEEERFQLDTMRNILCCDQLSFHAKGLFCYIINRPKDWPISPTAIAEEVSDNDVKSIKKSLRDLVEQGYLKENT